MRGKTERDGEIAGGTRKIVFQKIRFFGLEIQHGTPAIYVAPVMETLRMVDGRTVAPRAARM